MQWQENDELFTTDDSVQMIRLTYMQSKKKNIFMYVYCISLLKAAKKKDIERKRKKERIGPLNFSLSKLAMKFNGASIYRTILFFFFTRMHAFIIRYFIIPLTLLYRI